MARTEANQLVTTDQRVATVRQCLAKNMKGIQAGLAGYMDPARFMRTILTAVQNSPALLDCRKDTLLLSVLRLAQLNLSPDPLVGHAYIIPRKGRAELQLGYRGALALAYRSKQVRAIRGNVVREGEPFRWRDGRDWILEHEPGDSFDAPLVAAWVIIETVWGGSIPKVMRRKEVMAHKARSANVQSAAERGKETPWDTDEAAMWLKTCFAAAAKHGPFEGAEAAAFSLDREGEEGRGQPDSSGVLIDADFSVEGEDQPDNGRPKGALDQFKAAHRVQDPPEPQQEPSSGQDLPDGPAVGLSGSGAVLPPEEEGVSVQQGGGATSETAIPSAEPLTDAAPEVAQEPPGPPQPRRLAKEARARIYQFAGERGLDSVALERVIGKPIDQTDLDELAILGKIRSWKSPAKGKRS